MIDVTKLTDTHVYSQSEACDILGVTRPTLLKIRKSGLLKVHFKKYNGRPFYYGSDILNYIKKSV